MESSSRRSLRSSVIPLDEKLNKKAESKIRQDWLFKRYHDESYAVYVQQKTSIWDWIDDNFFLILPESTLLLWWNVLVIIAIFFNLFQIPLIIFFTRQVYQDEFNTAGALAINWIFAIVLLVHILFVRPSTIIYSRGVQITKHRILLAKYMKLQFWLNIIAWISLFVYLVGNDYSLVFFKLLFYLFLFSAFKINRQIQTKLELLRLRNAFYQLMRLLSLVMLVVIWLSCIYFYIDYQYYIQQNEYYPTQLWLTNSVCAMFHNEKYINLIQTYPWYVWLDYAVYWTIQTLSMVGYGDMTPRNPPQVLYCNLVVLVMTLIYAFFINTVWGIIGQVQELANTRQKNRRNLKNYQRQFKVPSTIGNKLGSYLFEVWQNGNNKQIEQHIEETLSTDLKTELFVNYRQSFFISIPLFKNLILIKSDFKQFFQDLVFQIKEQRYAENQIIFKKYDQNIQLYYLLIGQVQLKYPNSTVGLIVEQKTNFGSMQFFTKQIRCYEAFSTKFTKLSCLSLNDFIRSLKNYDFLYVNIPLMKEKYREMNEKIQISAQTSLAGEFCWQCLSPNHRTHHCPVYFQWYENMKKQALSSPPKMSKKVDTRRKYKRGNLKGKKKCVVYERKNVEEVVKKYGNYKAMENI